MMRRWATHPDLPTVLALRSGLCLQVRGHKGTKSAIA
jgi:hypothetical protein